MDHTSLRGSINTLETRIKSCTEDIAAAEERIRVLRESGPQFNEQWAINVLESLEDERVAQADNDLVRWSSLPGKIDSNDEVGEGGGAG